MLAKELKKCTTNDEIANAVLLAFPDLPEDYPIAYKAKKWFFYGLPFYVNRDVLVPRADTEILAEQVISGASLGKTAGLKILDLCTGSGCIAIAVAKHTEGTKVYASDISEKSLRVARKNAAINKVDVEFIKSDLFGGIGIQFDVIACNPPYVKTGELGKYDKSTLSEPCIALDGGAEGLGFYRRIAKEAPEYLSAGGTLALETGHDQAQAVKSILSKCGFCDIRIIKDLGKKDRVVICRKN